MQRGLEDKVGIEMRQEIRCVHKETGGRKRVKYLLLSRMRVDAHDKSSKKPQVIQKLVALVLLLILFILYFIYFIYLCK